MQEVDAERRIQILRGERPPTPPPLPSQRRSSDASARPERRFNDDAGGFRKRRRLAGEDDTDRDIRLAREDAAQAVAKREELSLTSRRDDKDAQAPLVDGAGHINLFPEGKNKEAEKNTEAEAESARKKRSYEDQYTMRFSNAAGFKETAGRQPWYSSGAQSTTAPDAMPEKNVWGNEDPMRKDREKARMDANDPLAAMKRGVRQLKATEQERKRWNEEKQKEIEALKTEEGQRSRHHRRKRSRSIDSLDDFKLDAPVAKPRDDNDHNCSRRHHRHHPRDRSRQRSHRDRDRERSHRRSHHSSDRAHRHRHDETHSDIRHLRKSELGMVYERR